MPDKGYVFAGWSDGYKDAFRIDYEVGSKIKVTAKFVKATDYDPANDDDFKPDPEDIPLPPSDDNKGGGPSKPSDRPSTDGDGKFNQNETVIDGEQNAGDHIGEATDNAQSDVNNNGNLTPGEGNLIGDYFNGISN